MDNRMTWAAGIFGDNNAHGKTFTTNTQFNLTGRVTGLPLYEDDGAKLVHLGLSVSNQFREGNTSSFATAPEAHLGKKYLTTGNFRSNGTTLVVGEIAWVHGPVSIQGEWKSAFENWLARRTPTPQVPMSRQAGS